mgnify:CR=1 FL=1
MFEAAAHPYLVPFDGSFRLEGAPTAPPDGTPGKKVLKKELKKHVARLREMQDVLYAADRKSVLLVFQAMDAAGKDGTIRAVMTGINPAGCHVVSFKQPSKEELDHDFLWRTNRQLPERGRIGIFNRSYYEEVLVVRVHPAILEHQRLPWRTEQPDVWEHRLTSILQLEEHLARNGTVVLKFFLNISKDEQKRRFLDRIDERSKNWKFSAGDVRERGHWDAYMAAYQSALSATSRPWAPWFAIPADDKPFMRATVADIVATTMESLDLRYPELDGSERARLDEMRALLMSEP